MKYTIQDIPKIVADRKLFDSVVYTPLEEALADIKKRSKDPELEKKLFAYLNGQIPEPMKGDDIRIALLRHIFTPNYELHRFICIADAMDLKTLFIEYLDDKFRTSNPSKYYLARMPFYFGKGKKGGVKVNYVNVLDINLANGKKLSELKTYWDQPLTDFHKELFFHYYKSKFNKDHFFDISSWYRDNGTMAKEYYNKLMALFVRNTVLFENFLLEKEELEFTKNIFLPAFFHVWEHFGVKPLIIALEPTDIEGSEFWASHFPDTEKKVREKMQSKKE